MSLAGLEPKTWGVLGILEQAHQPVCQGPHPFFFFFLRVRHLLPNAFQFRFLEPHYTLHKLIMGYFFPVSHLTPRFPYCPYPNPWCGEALTTLHVLDGRCKKLKHIRNSVRELMTWPQKAEELRISIPHPLSHLLHSVPLNEHVPSYFPTSNQKIEPVHEL